MKERALITGISFVVCLGVTDTACRADEPLPQPDPQVA